MTDIKVVCNLCPLPCTQTIGWKEEGGKLVIHQSRCIVFPSVTTGWKEQEEQRRLE